MSQCCENYQWEFVADAGKANGCEFTYGRCKACQSNLINLWYTPILGPGDNNVVVSQEFVDEMLRLEGKARNDFMRNWHHSLQE